MSNTQLLRLLRAFFLVVPVVLILYVFLGVANYGIEPRSFPLRLATWKRLWHLAYYLYILGGAMAGVLHYSQKKRKNQDMLNTFSFWFLGLILSMFSFAIAGIIVDIGLILEWVFYSGPD